MGPPVYSERDLVPVPGAPAPDGAPLLLVHWLAAPDPMELNRRIGRALRELGFDWMDCCAIALRDGAPSVVRCFGSHAHAAWTRTYFDEGLDKVDMRLAHALRSKVPFAWDVDEAAIWLGPQPTLQQQRVPQLLRAFGIQSGLTVIMPDGLRPDECTAVCLQSAQPRLGRMDDTVFGRSTVFALCLQQLLVTYRCLAPARAGTGARLSPTRVEILRQLALGQSNKQIAGRLQLSCDTIEYHLRELRRHFNARNRIELARATMGLGL